MSNQPHNESKKEFQLERMILFSDAVFAIAITLLVIEIKAPDIHENVSDKLLLESLSHLIPKFIGFLVSFMLIGLYWTVHHRMFGFVTDYNKRLLLLNLLFLFFIALMPFSSAFYSEYGGRELYEKQLKVPLIFYVSNFVCLGITNFLMWRYVSDPKNKLTDPPIDPVVLKLSKSRALIVPSIFLATIPVAYFINSVVAIYIPFLIPFVMRITKKIIERRHKKIKPSNS